MIGVVLAAWLLQQAAAAPGTLPAAVEASRAGRTTEAVQQLRAIVRKGPAEAAAPARVELVRIYSRKGEWLAAAEQLEELRKSDPANPEYAYELGVAYRNISQSAFLRVKEKAPESARFKQMEAEQLAAIGSVDLAIRRYRDAVAADPKLPGSHLGMAVLHLRSGRKPEALAEIAKELEITPESAVAKQIKASLEGGQ